MENLRNLWLTDERIYNITVQHLLEHTSGWDTTDLPFNLLSVTDALGEENPGNDRSIIKYSLTQSLINDPGAGYLYTNSGYILGRVIEKISGQSYSEYVEEAVFNPSGIHDIRPGKSLYEEKQEREAEYVVPMDTTLSFYGTGEMVPWQYGGFSMEAMLPAGGWIATPKDMVRLLCAVDGFSTRPDILSSQILTIMTTPSSANPNYAKGWAVNSADNWWHIGGMDGTQSVWVRTYHGFTWAAVLNGRTSGLDSALDNSMWDAINSVGQWPVHDFFQSPVENSSDLLFSNITANSANLTFYLLLLQKPGLYQIQ